MRTVGNQLSILDRFGAVLHSTQFNWNDLVGGNEIASDGFLQYSTQRYPDVPGAFAPIRLSIQGELADSHTGETASPEVLSVLANALALIGAAQ